ncbi:hypothetical protein HCJ39_07055 [Listeria rocourtiae]|uniref:hypothetical protein n=1 Tax=Listeria rocourtiae TaxID=647910 RepID=UPI00162A7F1D|nr:hypothetical protein [Listeria rocourtiae]MBC1604468.1 hypothetical protein [Listeria rocourtiae]
MKRNKKVVGAIYWGIWFLYVCAFTLFLLHQSYWWMIGAGALGMTLIILAIQRSHRKKEQRLRRRFGIDKKQKGASVASLFHLKKFSLQQLDDIVQHELSGVWLGKRRRRRYEQLAVAIDDMLLHYKQQEENTQTLEQMRMSVLHHHFFSMGKQTGEVWRTNDPNVYTVIVAFVRYQVEFEGTSIKVCMPIIKTV